MRRAALARAIVTEPAIVLCDEPFSGLDPPNVSRIEALLRDLNENLGLTLIVTSHHMASSPSYGRSDLSDSREGLSFWQPSRIGWE